MSISVFVFAIALPAAADSPNARALYDEGKAAYDSGDYTHAAASFARADELAPNATVLDLAISSAVQAHDPVLGMTLTERAERRGLDALAQTGRHAFEGAVGRLEVACPGVERCSASIDGAATSVDSPVWCTVGEHAIELDADGNVERFTATVMASQITTVRPTRLLKIGVAPPPPPVTTVALVRPRETAEPRKLAPPWFVGVAAGAFVAGGATIVSAADMLSKHAAFARDPTSASAADDGRTAQARTNVLLATTAAFAVGAVVIGVFFTRWHTTRSPEVPYASFASFPSF